MTQNLQNGFELTKVERVVPWRAVAMRRRAQRIGKRDAALLHDIRAFGELASPSEKSIHLWVPAV